MSRRAFLLLPALAACGPAALAPAETAALPPGSTEGAGDPLRAAVLRAAYAFAHPATLAGRPDAAGRALADMEYLAANLPGDPRWDRLDPLLPVRLQQARAEWRAAVALPPALPPQAALDALLAPPPALRDRLAGLPPLPRTLEAATAAQRVLERPDLSRPQGGFGLFPR